MPVKPKQQYRKSSFNQIVVKILILCKNPVLIKDIDFRYIIKRLFKTIIRSISSRVKKIKPFCISALNTIKYKTKPEVQVPIRIDHLPWQLKKRFSKKYEILYPNEMADDRYGIRELQLSKVCQKYMPKNKDGLYQRKWSKEMIGELKSLAGNRTDFSCESYPGSVPQFYAALDNIKVDGKKAMVIGSVSPWLECILLAYKAREVLTVEYGKIPCNSDEIKIIDRLTTKFPEKENYDIICSFSSIEHNGLGRYGDPIDPDGDNKAMDEMYDMLITGGIALIGIPVAINNVLVGNGHRAYSKDYLENHLFGKFKILGEIAYPFGAKEVNYTTDKLDWRNQPLFILEKI